MTGEQLKEEGIERIRGTNEEWLKYAEMAIKTLRLTKDEFTTDDLKPFVNAPNSPNSYGAAFNVAAKAGLIKRVGYRKSTSPSAHGRVVSVWAKA